MIQFGNNEIKEIYFGSDKIKEVYHGSDLVWGETPIEGWDGIFADPEVGRVLQANGLIADANKSSIEELATITSLNPSNTWNGSYFYNNKVITQFPELQYCIGLTNLYGTFYGCSNLTTAPVIPDSVTNLYYTFYYCSSLTTAPVIPERITSLDGTFEGCSSLTTAPVIPDGVTGLHSTFSGCSSLTTAPVIPEGVTDLNRTFYYCSSLTTAPVIPDSVVDLSYVFRGCSNIDGVYIINIVTPPSYVKSLSNVQAIYVPDASVSAYKSASGWIEFADKIYPMSNKPQ